MKAISLAAALLVPLSLSPLEPAVADDAAPAPKVEWLPEFTPYYTDVELLVPLTGKPIPDNSGEDEFEIYRQLFAASLHPQVLMFEASVYPMPVLGTWVRRHEPGFYEDAQLTGDFNWIESITAGFSEPGAISMFLGSTMNLVREGEARREKNKGHMGYLVSAGTRHIRKNVLIHDDWYEFEWKLKGEREFADDRLSWSFRVGTQQHNNPDIADQVYAGLRRTNLDWRAAFLSSWLNNTAVSSKIGLTASTLQPAHAELILEKSYPISRRYMLALDVGFVYEAERAYTGTLSGGSDEFIFVIHPNIQF